MFNFNPADLIIYFVVFLFSLSFHEAAHAWTSERFGDSTGRYLGRVTLNPLPHIDPIGTILFPLLGFMGGGMMFGWAKPVPVNPLNWRDKKLANILTSLAGPASNLLLATVAFIILKGLIISGQVYSFNGQLAIAEQSPFLSFSVNVLWMTLILNIILGVFNLIPIPPLDGSHIMEELLPPEAARSYEQIRPYGFILLVGLMFLGVFGYILNPFLQFVRFIL